MTTSTGAGTSIDSLVDLARDLRSGELAAADYVGLLEARFAQRESELQSFVDDSHRWERYRGNLEELSQTYPDPKGRPPLFGVPFGVKDIFHVDGFATGAGSKLPAEDLAGPQSVAVSILQEAGAVVLGKTITTEFAYFSPGPTRNPLDAGRTPGGSSSGSAAAVGAGLCPLAFGTQTIGSIGRPASYCGVVGFKPTFGRISADGVIPLAPSLDHIGFFTRDVPSADLAAKLLCRQWRTEGPGGGLPVLGIPSENYLGNASAETLRGFRDTVDSLATAGYEVRSVPALANSEEIDFRHRLLTAADAARVHATWYARYRDRYAPKTVELIERGLPVSDDELETLRAGPDQLRTELEEAMTRHGIDLWVSPAAPGPAPLGIDSTGDPVMNLPWTHAGVPTLSLPGWKVEGLPVGLQLAARFGDDESLLAWAIDIEEALDS